MLQPEGHSAGDRIFEGAADVERVPAPRRLLEIVVLLLAAAIASFLLFVPPVVGLADQTDFARVMEGVGIQYPSSVPNSQRYWCYLETTYPLAPLHLPPFASSESVFVILARVMAYNSISLQVLPYSPSPAADLVALGLDPTFTRYSGTSAFQASAPSYNPASFPQRASYGRLLTFYLSRPARLLGLTSRGIEAALSNRVAMLGNYERSAGRPCQSLSPAFSLWDSTRKTLRNPWLVAAFLLLNIMVPLAVSLHVDDTRTSVLLQFHATMALTACLLFYAAIMADGNEFQKHLFVFNFLFDCCLAADVLWVAERLHSIACSVRAVVRFGYLNGHRSTFDLAVRPLFANDASLEHDRAR
jgi:small basic protein